MKKLILLLVTILVGCSIQEQNVTFILDVDTDKEVYLLQRGSSSISSPVKTYQMDKIDNGYRVSTEITPNSLYRYSYAISISTGLDYEQNTHGQTASRAVVVRDGGIIEDTFIKNGSKDIEVTV